jgi:hypothetical protein
MREVLTIPAARALRRLQLDQRRLFEIHDFARASIWGVYVAEARQRFVVTALGA